MKSHDGVVWHVDVGGEDEKEIRKNAEFQADLLVKTGSKKFHFVRIMTTEERGQHEMDKVDA